jgi:rod shape determining protein RodA
MLDFVKNKLNYKLVLPMFLIYFLGFIVIYSTTQGLYENHLTNFGIGLVIFFIFQFVDLEVLVKKSFYLYLVVFILLLLIFVIGHTALGASRWLRIGELSLQPSEFAKISTILLISYILSGYREWTLRLKKITLKIKNRFIQSFILTLPLLVMVLIQPDLGTTISIFLVFVGLLFISSFEKKYFLIALILAGIFSNPLWNSLQDYQKERVLIFLNPQMDPFGSGYNTIQAEIAVGSGGFWGKGYAKGTQTQLNFLPIFWTDFLVATYAEEWGFFGMLFFISVYFYLLFQIYLVFVNTKIVINKFVSFGIFIYYSGQFLINFGMNIGLLPVTGIPIPLFSYGGTSLISSIFLLSVLNKISLDKSN